MKKKPNFPPFFDIKWLQIILRHENDQYQCLWWQLAAYIKAAIAYIAKNDSGSFGCVVTSKQCDWLTYSCILSGKSVKKGTFNNYVDNKRWVGGQKMPIFVHVQG